MVGRKADMGLGSKREPLTEPDSLSGTQCRRRSGGRQAGLFFARPAGARLAQQQIDDCRGPDPDDCGGGDHEIDMGEARAHLLRQGIEGIRNLVGSV